MMTRKHFKQFAEVIKDNRSNIKNVDRLINDLSLIFMRDNSNFNKSRFVEACDEREKV
jgi:hypothetical protein